MATLESISDKLDIVINMLSEMPDNTMYSVWTTQLPVSPKLLPDSELYPNNTLYPQGE